MTNDSLKEDPRQIPPNRVPAGTRVQARCRTRLGISDTYIPKGKKGTLVSHYKALYDRKERYLIKWDSRNDEGSHIKGEIKVLDE